MIRHLKLVLNFGTPTILACDGKCHKAWGHNNRPRTMLGADIGGDIDDYVYKGDWELGEAPIDPGTYECDDAKPTSPDEILNKWCARECERSVKESKRGVLIELPNMESPLPNFGARHEEWRKMHPLCANCGCERRHHNSMGHDSGGCTLCGECLDYQRPR